MLFLFSVPQIVRWEDSRAIEVSGTLFFPIGVTYHFYRHSGTLEQDLQKMKDAGINTVRGDTGWAEIETSDGYYDFSQVDQFLSATAEKGLYVVLSFQYCSGGDLSPSWLDSIQEWRILDYTLSYPWGDRAGSPGSTFFRSRFYDYVGNFTLHLKVRNPWNLLAVQLWNEPHFPEDGPLCDYNPETIERFRSWLCEKYGGDIDRLNQFWGTSYTNFEDVNPPYVNPSNWKDTDYNRAAFLDWRLFTEELWAEFIDGAISRVKSVWPSLPVLVTEMPWWFWGQGAYSGASLKIYRNADIIGFDIYPNGEEEWDVPGFIASFIRSFYPDKVIWLTEINDKDGDSSYDSLKSYAESVVYEGVSGYFFFEWTDADHDIDGGYYGLVSPYGNPKSQYHAFSQLVPWLKSAFESRTSPQEPIAGVFWSWTSSILTFGEMRSSYAPRTVYRYLRRMGCRAFFFSGENFNGTFPEGMPLIFSDMRFLDEVESEIFKSAVASNPSIVAVPVGEYLVGSSGVNYGGGYLIRNIFGISLLSYYETDLPGRFSFLKSFGTIGEGTAVEGWKYHVEFIVPSENSSFQIVANWTDGGAVISTPELKTVLVGTESLSGEIWNYSSFQVDVFSNILSAFLSANLPEGSVVQSSPWKDTLESHNHIDSRNRVLFIKVRDGRFSMSRGCIPQDADSFEILSLSGKKIPVLIQNEDEIDLPGDLEGGVFLLVCSREGEVMDTFLLFIVK